MDADERWKKHVEKMAHAAQLAKESLSAIDRENAAVHAEYGY